MPLLSLLSQPLLYSVVTSVIFTRNTYLIHITTYAFFFLVMIWLTGQTTHEVGLSTYADFWKWLAFRVILLVDECDQSDEPNQLRSNTCLITPFSNVLKSQGLRGPIVNPCKVSTIGCATSTLLKDRFCAPKLGRGLRIIPVVKNQKGKWIELIKGLTESSPLHLPGMPMHGPVDRLVFSISSPRS